ncbi:1-acyl-sn-glycerol-3-phosphate acyltransferase [Algoriphagus zhangzhouensis]|uniref:Acyltransferase n=1 Tax=Algoriphagus zhangzhouensis TaxID=1073327 RepID=A0A1M7ZCE5_9BACT|nr:1-acyl-sn-glycerol-3-phosphate acyltransferase [Algoriphagus zhangzhouensis]TDY45531.1 acyltransferase-like protein [Algoriphagus zhangzhouensis]SHO62512.1 Acyltransferase [Algoriphagus zhangzhouensis]
MMKFLSRIVFWITGWSLNDNWPKGLKKAVMIAIPHTSNWDLLYARAAFYLMDIPVKFTIKKEVMVGPLGWLIKGLGGIAIDRKRIPGGRKQTYTEAMVNMLKESDELVIMVTPEGTRSAVKKWKSGFYHIALGADVPVVVGYLDYKKKEAGIGPAIYPNGDMEGQIEEMMAFGRNVTGKYPEKGIQ